MIREQIGEWMESLGFSVTYANCGATALDKIRQSRPDMVVTDIDMPHLSGLHLLQMLRDDPDSKIADVPVIVSSSLEDPSVTRIVARLRGSVFLKKPVSRERLETCVKALMRGIKINSDIVNTEPHHVSPRFRRIASDWQWDGPG